MKLVKLEVPDDVKAITVTVLTPNCKTSGLAMITKGIDTVDLENEKTMKIEIEED
ncbi:hypothetical protein [Vagococcus carniphilus]|uniref:hypothetical protein n=1 Tax=Vagococcus carniphilus TaxID=218144 RepID=UPI00288DA6AD|nr:hypothetical protein [Vagococcus carniphilus]MDT2814346.1 hypothetical protein [Vagococcus carniphilus]